MAFHAGFVGQKGGTHLARPDEDFGGLGFHRFAARPVRGNELRPDTKSVSGDPGYFIDRDNPGVREDKYNALMERAGEIGATDLDMPDPWASPTEEAEAKPPPVTPEDAKDAAE